MIGVNPQSRRAVIINNWGYAMAEICAGELRVDDVVEGNVEALGPNTWLNVSTRQSVSVNITHVQATMVDAHRWLAGP